MCSGQAAQEALGWGGLNKLTFSLGLNCQKWHLLWHHMSDQQQMPHPSTLYKRSPENKKGQN